MKTQSKVFFNNDSASGAGTPVINTVGVEYNIYTVPAGKENQMRISFSNRHSGVSANVSVLMKLAVLPSGETLDPYMHTVFFGKVDPSGIPYVTDVLHMKAGDKVYVMFQDALGIVSIRGDGLEITPES